MRIRLSLILLLIITALSTIVYLNALDNGFHYDDEHYIVNNHFLERWENIPALFTTTRYYSDDMRFTGHYRPLLYVTYAFNKVIGGNNPFGYHIVNLIFHIGSAFLMFLILKAMLGSIGGGLVPLATALIFALHPFNSEAVNYITARSSVMSGFFYLLSFYCWVRFRGGAADVSRLTSYFYLTSLLTFLLGMLSKEVVITLPIVLWLYDLYFQRPNKLGNYGQVRTPHSVPRTLLNWRTYLPYLPFILSVLIPYFLIRWIQYRVLTVHSFNRDIYSNFLNQCYVLIKYIGMLIVPVGQSVYHDILLTTTIMDWRVILSLLLLAGIGIVTFLLARSNNIEGRTISFFSLWFFVTLLPTTLIPLNDILQENRGYLAGASFAIIAALFMGRLLVKGRWTFFLCLGLLLIVYSGATFKRNSIWQDEYTLWSDVLVKYPDSFKAYHSIGQAYLDQGENEKAIGYFKKSVQIYPTLYTAYNALGIIYGERGETESAIAMFKKTIELRSDFPRAYYNLGTTYFLNHNFPLAVENYKKAIEVSPHYLEPYMALGEIYMKQGDTGSAEAMFKKVISYRPSDPRPYLRLALMYETQGKRDLAIEYYKSALKTDPGLTGVKERLGRLGG